MATYVWNGTPETSSDWDTPANWLGGVVPNAPDANVVFPSLTDAAGNQAAYFVTIAAGETISAGAVALSSYLSIDGVLDVTNAAIGTGGAIDMDRGTLSLVSLDDANGYDIQGAGTIVSAGSVVNAGEISGGAFVLAFGSFDNTGTILANSATVALDGMVIASPGTVALDVTGDPGSFVNLSGGTLTAGSFAAENGGVLVLPASSMIVVDASTISLDATLSRIMQVGPTGTSEIQSTLATIASSGVLTVSGAYTTANTIEVDGTLTVMYGAAFSTPGLLVGTHGLIGGSGTISGPIAGSGTIVATDTLLVASSLVGPAAQIYGTLDLAGAARSELTFASTDGNVSGISALVLSDPGGLDGSISGLNDLYTVSTGFRNPDVLQTFPEEIVLRGVALASVLGETYTTNTDGGILKLQLASGSIALDFIGEYSISDFALSAGSQPYSNSPPNVIITDPIIHLTDAVPTIDAGNDSFGRWIEGNQSGARIELAGGNQTIVLTGSSESIRAIGASPFNDLILGPAGSSTIALGDGYQTVVAFGASNTISVGNAGTLPGAGGDLSYINAGTGQETVTAGDGTNVINTGGYGDTIMTGRGLNLIFATDLGTVSAPATLGAAGRTTLSLGSGNNFAYLHGASNRITEGGGTDAIWGGTGGGDSFSLAASGGVLFVENFGGGDVLDLSKLLAGAPLATDLYNISNFVSVVAIGADDAVFGVNDGGSKTVLQVIGAGGTAFINLENVGSLSVAGLIGQGALALPPH